ncbi:MAG TPA: fibronectin type III domain-containing protein, partial [Dissulfuribacter thermophilus]|nr:fibronectin type III domain-containing protein [Dissulfuribacter thermophilus]
FSNLGNGLYWDGGGSVVAEDNWWGDPTGPSGAGPGAGDEVSSGVDFEPFRTSGTEYGYFDAGPNTNQGTLNAPSVIQGTSSTEWGTEPQKSILFDLDKVVLEYTGLNTTKQYDLFIIYFNADDTAAIGGNIQDLTDGSGILIHGPYKLPSSNPILMHYQLPLSSTSSGTLRLNFNKLNGYRAVVSSVLLMERSTYGDTTSPTTTITSPVDGAYLNGTQAKVTGTAQDTGGTGVVSVEVGVDDGTNINWYPVTALHSDGTWEFFWTLPQDGNYTLYSRSRDLAGNLGLPLKGPMVYVKNTPPAPPESLSAHDGIGDSGGRIVITWSPSPDESQGIIASYVVERSESGGTDDFSTMGTVSPGTTSFTDNSTTDGTDYYYRVVAVDLAGNRGESSIYGPVISIDNTIPDSTPPEDVTGLTATPGNELIILSWTPSVDSARDLVDQILETSTDGSTWSGALSLGKDTSFYTVTGLTNGNQYWFRIRVKDSSNNLSSGTVVGPVTPSATSVITVSGHITKDTVWAGGVYYVNGYVTVDSGVTLTINPGVIVKFGSGGHLDIYGRLDAQGTT